MSKRFTICLFTSLFCLSFFTVCSANQRSITRLDNANTVVKTDKAHIHQQVFSSKIQKILDGYDKKKAPAAANIPIGDPSILGQAVATPDQCVRYLLQVNPHPEITVSPQQLVAYYYREGSYEGVRPDIAFAQALVETGFFRYGGTVTPDQNNYCGLGTTNTIVKGAYFATSELGVRAHIQHLLAYASNLPPKDPIVDPRYSLVRSIYQSHTLSSWEDLNGRWAVPGDTYGQSILRIYHGILNS